MIEFEKVSLKYTDEQTAVNDLSFNIEKGKSFVLLGTSGSGKTSVLKMVNRLVEPTSGSILFNGQPLSSFDLINLRRKMGYVVQDVGLFDHFTIEENILLPLKLQKQEKSVCEKSLMQVMEKVQLDRSLLSRRPFELSGGQKQRVGIARALVHDPEIILMDEPFSSLDPITRERLQEEVSDLIFSLKKTLIFVTHDVLEAIKIADQIILLDQGKLQFLGSSLELLKQEDGIADSFIASHRVQLSLHAHILRTLRSKLKKKKIDSSTKLFFRHTYMEAIDIFRFSGENFLPVYEAHSYMGHLKKKDLMDAMKTALKESI